MPAQVPRDFLHGRVTQDDSGFLVEPSVLLPFVPPTHIGSAADYCEANRIGFA